jgi:CxxC motif-containing protein (DUF1111 family)
MVLLLAACAVFVPIAIGVSHNEDSALPPAKLGGKGSARELRERPLNQPARTLTNAGRRDFGAGAILFRDSAAWVNGGREDVVGLGPTFIQDSCVACHVDGLDDGGPVEPTTEAPEGLPSPGLVVRISDGVDERGAPQPDPRFGLELQTSSVSDVASEGSLTAQWTSTTVVLDDGTEVAMHRPTVRFEPTGGAPVPRTMSARIAPPLVGLSLLESIPAEALDAAADPSDADGDGISGEVQRVWDSDAAQFVVGRFGWKAIQPTVRAQTAAAAAFDVGVTSERQPNDCDETPCPPDVASDTVVVEGDTVDLDERQFDELAVYTEAIAVPESQPLRSPDEKLRRGSDLFASTGCGSCHASGQLTGPSTVPGHIEVEKIYPYTDLLLHDMGPQLADGRVEYRASGSEWRTPPLWSNWLRNKIGFGRYLHDGRAGTVEEAILWHGGEGQAARDGFAGLSKEDRDALVAFVKSL